MKPAARGLRGDVDQDIDLILSGDSGKHTDRELQELID